MKPALPLALLVASACCGLHKPDLQIDPNDGHIISFHQDNIEVQFRKDDYKGPAFEGITLSPSGKGTFSSIKDSLEYTLQYSSKKDHIDIKVGIENKSSKDYTAELRERLFLGIDTEMLSYPQWDSVLFPTLIRCEKDFVWGYFSGTDGQVLAFASSEPVASYGLNYKYEGIKEWMWGHSIYTASLDLIHCGPLPKRHPQNLDCIHSGQKLSWTIHMGIVESLDKVKPALSKWADIPMIELSAYTVPKGTDIEITTFRSGKKSVETIQSPQELGLHTITCESKGKTAEASYFVRPDWEWYGNAARKFIAQYPPRMGNSCESFYGYLPAFLTAKRNPDPKLDRIIEEQLIKDLPKIVDTTTWIPYPERLPERVQNFSTLAVALARYYDSGADSRWLRYATNVADYVISKQSKDGAFRSEGIHYTAVIYPAKSMFEVSAIERRAGKTEAADRHWNAAMHACLDLADRLDNIQTEGEMTFEDGMITCSALQMAYAALQTDDPAIRKKLTDGAEYMMRKHRCLEQNLVPDCRMRGATLRWWEALDIYFSPNQVMNSPHGWSAWKAYAVGYLFKLTGKEEYRRDLEDLLGSCAQLMDLDGHLRWGFLPDPYVDGRICIPADKPYQWTTTDGIVGEQYMELISTWCRSEDGKAANFGEFGGCGDGTVYEIFNAIEELCIQPEELLSETDPS